MSNILNVVPTAIDTDLASYQAAQTLTAQSEQLGLKVKQIALVANGATSAGTVTVTDPISGANLLPPMVVAAALASGTLIFFQSYPGANWQDFKVTGVTATGTRLCIWWTR